MTAHEKPMDRARAASGTSRRSFLQMAGIGTLGLTGLGALAACGSSTSSGAGSGTGGAGNYGEISVQLSWIKNVEFAGEYFADSKGYYKAAGFSKVNLLAGGAASTSPESLVLTGKALTGMSTPIVTSAAIVKQDAPLKIIGSTYQKNPFCILSLADKTPIRTAADMRGKKIGVQTGSNEAIWAGFLKVNGIDPSELTKVPVQYDPTVVANGSVDGYFAYVTTEPVLLEEKGLQPVVLSFADNGLEFTAETLIATEASIKSKPDMLKAFLKAEVQGWNDAVANPAGAAELAVNVYGKDLKLDLAEQTKEAIAQNGLVVTADTKKNGLFTMTDALIEKNISALSAMGTTITASKLYDLSLIKQVFEENPDLIVA